MDDEEDNNNVRADFTLVELVLLYGPPFSGKSAYYKKRMSLAESSGLSIHRAVKTAADRLLAGENVVIDDCNAHVATRKSFIGPIKSKVPSCAVRSVHINDVGGVSQCRWAATWAMAERAMLKQPFSRSLLDIDEWFLKEEGFAETSSVSFPLYSLADHFDTPGLILDCKSILTFQNVNNEVTATLRENVGPVLREWHRSHSNSRSIVLIDEASLFPTTIELASSVPQLSSQLAHCRKLIRDLFLSLHLLSPLYFTCVGYGLPEKNDSPVSALPAQVGINFMKADIFFGKSGWSLSSKLYGNNLSISFSQRMFTQDNSTNVPPFLTSITHETGHVDPAEAADMSIDAAHDDLTESCVIEENGLYGISNFVIVYPPFTEPEPTPSPAKQQESPSKPLPSTPSTFSSPSSNLPTKLQTPPKASIVCPVLTNSQIQSWVPDRNSFSNGQIYCSKNMVLNFEVESGIPYRCTQPEPYDVWAEIDTESSPTIVGSFCSCPAGEYSNGKCKHVAALLLYSNNTNKSNQPNSLPKQLQFTPKTPSSNLGVPKKPAAPITPATSSTPSSAAGTPRRGLPAWMESPFKTPKKSDTPSTNKKRKKPDKDNEEDEKKEGSPKKQQRKKKTEDGKDEAKKSSAPSAKKSANKSQQIKKQNPFYEDSFDEIDITKNDNEEDFTPKKLQFDDPTNKQPTLSRKDSESDTTLFDSLLSKKPFSSNKNTSPPPSDDSPPSQSLPSHPAPNDTTTSTADNSFNNIPSSSYNNNDNNNNTLNNNDANDISSSPFNTSLSSSPFKATTSSPSSTPKKVMSLKDFLKVKKVT